MNADSKTSIKSLLRHQRPLLRKDSGFVRTIVDGDGYIKIPFTPSSTKSLITRTFIIDDEQYSEYKRPFEPYIKSHSSALNDFLNSDFRNTVNYKAAVFSTPTRSRMGSSMSVKVGLIGSSGTIGQAVQGAGSIATPGDLSGIRSPIRSRAYSALIPGGNTGFGKLRRITPKPTRGFRCSSGFQFGGRFTDERYSTCGAQLFDIPSPIGALIGATRRANSKPRLTSFAADSLAETVTGGDSGSNTAAILRMAQIPRTGADKPAERMKAVQSAIRTVTGAPTTEGRLIRRDGVVLKPVVPSSVLRKFSGNSDMGGGVLVRPIQTPKDITGDDLALLSGPAVRQVTYVMPNGSTLTIERARDLTVGERRKFGRQLNRVGGESDQYDVGNNIRDFANASGGAFKYTEKFPDIENPNDLISVSNGNGGKVEVRRWVYETFMSNGKGKGRAKPVTSSANVETVRADATPKNDSVSSLAESIKLLDDGGNPFDISSEFISAALSGSKSYKSSALGTGIIKHQKGDGKSVLQVPETMTYGSLAEKVYADIASHAGLKMPNTKIGGNPTKRDLIMNDVNQGETRFDTSVDFTKVPKGELLRVALTDYLTDRRDRSPATLSPARDGSRLILMPSSNERSNMAGLSKEDIERRFKLDLPDYMDERGARIFKQSLSGSTENERKMLASLVDDLLKKLSTFNWDEYMSRLVAGGNLSDAERNHLSIIKKLYTGRLENLTRQKVQFNKLVGI